MNDEVRRAAERRIAELRDQARHAPPIPGDPRLQRVNAVFGRLTGVAFLAAVPFVIALLYAFGDEPFVVDSAWKGLAVGSLTGAPAVCAVWLGMHRLVDDPASDVWRQRPAIGAGLMWLVFMVGVAALSLPAAAALLISTALVAWLLAAMRGTMRVAISEVEGAPAELQLTIGQIGAATFAAAATFAVVRGAANFPGPINEMSAVLIAASVWLFADYMAAWLILAVDVHVVGWAAAIGASFLGGLILSTAQKSPLSVGAALLTGHSLVLCLALQTSRAYSVRLVKSSAHGSEASGLKATVEKRM